MVELVIDDNSNVGGPMHSAGSSYIRSRFFGTIEAAKKAAEKMNVRDGTDWEPRWSKHGRGRTLEWYWDAGHYGFTVREVHAE